MRWQSPLPSIGNTSPEAPREPKEPCEPKAAGLGLVLSLVTVLATLVLAVWADSVAEPQRVERVEVHVRSLIIGWQAGQSPWRSATELPYLQNPYGPVYLGLSALLPEIGERPYALGRLVSIAAFLGVLGLIYRWVLRRTGEHRLALLAALLPLTAKPVFLFVPLDRVDSVGVLASFAGFLLAISNPAVGSTIVAALLFVLAFHTKLTFLAGALASIVALWMRHRGQAKLLIVLLALLLPGSLLLMEILTEGAYVAAGMFDALDAKPAKAVDMTLRVGLSCFWLAALVWAALRSERFHPDFRPLLVYAGLCLATAAFFAVNPLSSWNYLIELYAALGLLTGVVLAGEECPRRLRARALRSRLLLGHVLLSMVVLAMTWRHQREEMARYRSEYTVAVRCLSADRARLAPLAYAHSEVHRDVLNRLGIQSAFYVPSALMSAWDVRALAASARVGEQGVGVLDSCLRSVRLAGRAVAP